MLFWLGILLCYGPVGGMVALLLSLSSSWFTRVLVGGFWCIYVLICFWGHKFYLPFVFCVPGRLFIENGSLVFMGSKLREELGMGKLPYLNV
jgi:hypothetical protein